MFRFFYIFFLISKYSFILVLSKYGFKKVQKPKLIRDFFEEAGGTFIKFGQILSLRVDIISDEYAIELLGLLDDIQPFPYKEVERIFLEDLGAKPEKIFNDFQKKPFASASFGQVHGAKLKDDTIVAVKVLRPDINQKVAVDFFVLDFFAFVADLFFKIEALPWKEVVSEFKAWTIQELDYRTEAENGEKLYRNNLQSENIVIPKIYHDLTTKRILVEEYLYGFHLNRILKRMKENKLNDEMLLKMGVNIKMVPKILSFELFKQFFLDGIYHADPHPGNIILLPNGKIGFIDFGIVGGKEPIPNKESLMRWAKATSEYDFKDASTGSYSFKEASFHMTNFTADELKTIFISAMPATVDPKAADEFLSVISDHFSKVVEKVITENFSNLKELKVDYITVAMKLAKMARRYKIKLPKEFVIFLRTGAIFSILAKQMDKDFYITDEMKNFFKIYPEEELVKNFKPYVIKRINREKALENLSQWLSYLFEIDPTIYKLVRDYLSKYEIVDM